MTRLDDNAIQLGDAGPRAKLLALVLGAGGLALAFILWGAGTVLTEGRFFRAYLTGFMLVTAISLGGLIFVMIQHATRAGWSVAVRRLFEIFAANLQWIWILFIPVLVAMWMSPKTHLYEWAIPEIVEHDPVLQGKAGFLDPMFWTIRAVIYFGLWAFLSRFFLRHSVMQDADGNVEHTHSMQRLAPVGIMLFAVSITLAAIDWMMSLSPHWFSTIFGVYFFAASCCAFFAVMLITLFLLQRAGKLEGIVTAEHYQDIGKLLFGFGTVFWAYIAFSQMMLIWYANIPEETTFFFIRSQAGWWGLSVLLLVGHFFIPFLGIMSRHPKRYPAVIAFAGGWMLLMAAIDFYWLVMPVIPAELLHDASPVAFAETVDKFTTDATVPATSLGHHGLPEDAAVTYRQLYGFRPHLVDLAVLVGMLGLLAFGTLRTMGRVALVCKEDPRLPESLAFENM